MLKDFKEFAMRGNVVDMAVGIIIGAAFGTIVKSLVADVIMPPIGLLLGNVDFSELDVDYSLPQKASYTWRQLSDFCNKDPDCVLTFYGGEPLVCIEEIRQVMDVVKPKHFMILVIAEYVR